jgi:membrane-bound lytic murein transglycosylase C
MRTDIQLFIAILAALAAGPALYACSTGEAARVARIVVTRDTSSAGVMAAEKAAGYAVNPGALVRDIERFKERVRTFRRAVRGIWGEKEAAEPRPKVYVKYVNNYLSRAMVDFDRGVVTVETLDKDSPLERLKSAVMSTVLTPSDPRAVDLYSSGDVEIGETPFLFGEVKDFEGRNIRWEWRAGRFADRLVDRGVRVRTIKTEEGFKTAWSVGFPLVEDHLQVRAAKYKDEVKAQAARFGVSRNLIFAVIRTESDFNPFAVSSAPAFGLMQIVPESAGTEVYEYLNGKRGRPSREFLFVPRNNIEYGAAYLHLLERRYLPSVANPVSREYLTIAAYNTGPGNALRTFSRDRETALARINRMNPLEVYGKLKSDLPYAETRRYLDKVLAAKKDFVVR